MAIKLEATIESEVMRLNQAAITGGRLTEAGLLIEMDVRRLDHHARLGLPRSLKIHWHHETTIEVQEIGVFGYAIRYRILWADGYYFRDGQRISVTPKVAGVDIDRRVSERVLDVTALLYVRGGVGLEATATLLALVGRVSTTKSSVDRWIREAADQAPSSEEIFKELNRSAPITEAHLDEIYPRGQDGCAIVIRDEHGRICAMEKLERKEWEKVKDFLIKLGLWGLKAKVFYTDGCEAFRKAIQIAFPEAKRQLDLFHLLQSALRPLTKAAVRLRRKFKEYARNSWTPSFQNQMTRLAARLWENRHLLFKAEERLSEEEKVILRQTIEGHRRVSLIRAFWVRLRDVFHESDSEKAARIRLGMLRRDFAPYRAFPFARILGNLEEMGEDVFTYLRCRKVKHNSLAETGMRVLRRLERNHDGFRTEEGLDRFIRLYQAMVYLGWRPFLASG